MPHSADRHGEQAGKAFLLLPLPGPKPILQIPVLPAGVPGRDLPSFQTRCVCEAPRGLRPPSSNYSRTNSPWYTALLSSVPALPLFFRSVLQSNKRDCKVAPRLHSLHSAIPVLPVHMLLLHPAHRAIPVPD